MIIFAIKDTLMAKLVAESVYIIAKALTVEELNKLYILLKRDLKQLSTDKSEKQKKLITNEEAMIFILKTVFCKNNNQSIVVAKI